MHDFTVARDADVHHGRADRKSRIGRIISDYVIRHRRLGMFVGIPTILVAAFLYLVVADQYETEAHFVVRTSETSRGSPGGLGQALTLVGGGAAPADKDAMIVADYLTSHDAVAALQRRIDLVEMFRRPEADLFSRLWSKNPAPETLLHFYNGKVNVHINSESGIAVLNVRAFRPSDSLSIIQQLLLLSEARVNALNQRNFSSAVEMSRQQVREAEADVQQAQNRITAFRRGSRDFNPQTTGQARTGLISALQAQLATARAQLDAMAAGLSPNSPQLVAMRNRVTALASQAAAEKSEIASGPGNVAVGLGAYEGLQLRQQLAGKQYEAATAALQRAQDDANKQQLFIVRVVDPNLPVKSLYPKRLKLTITILFGLLLTYGIGWLIAAGVKEHAS